MFPDSHFFVCASNLENLKYSCLGKCCIIFHSKGSFFKETKVVEISCHDDWMFKRVWDEGIPMVLKLEFLISSALKETMSVFRPYIFLTVEYFQIPDTWKKEIFQKWRPASLLRHAHTGDISSPRGPSIWKAPQSLICGLPRMHVQ